MEAYLRRLAHELGRTVVTVEPLKPMPADRWMPYAEPMDAGEDREEEP
jgi:hypothetical protein